MLTPALNCTDGYKVGHHSQMPEEVYYQGNNFTPRKTRRKNVTKIMFFGQQYFIKKYLIQGFNETFFKLPKAVAIAKYKRRIDNYLGKQPEDSYQHISDLYDLGYLPIRIKSLKEGTRVNIKVPPVFIESTIDGEEGKKYVWLVGYLETIYSTTVWGPCTSATTAFEFRKMLNKFAMETVGNTDFVPWQGHDFSMRGMFGLEAAQMSGAAHLLSFVGSDTLPAIDFLEEYYGANSDEEIVAQSVNATEHSVMCLGTGFYIYNVAKGDWTRIGAAEFSVFKRLITEVCPNGIISIVSDTFNLWTVLVKFLVELKDEVMARDGKIVIRPDSGDPSDIMCGTLDKVTECNSIYIDSIDKFKTWAYEGIIDLVAEDTPHGEHGVEEETVRYKFQDKYYDVTVSGIQWNRYDKQYYFIDNYTIPTITLKEVAVEPQHLGVINLLWNTFGGTITEKGFKLLDSHVGAIYGDSINQERGIDINTRLKKQGFASINWVAGLGSFSYQFVTRDTDGWAMKATIGGAINAEGQRFEIPVFKDPITDDGTKKSARGGIKVVKHITGDQMSHKVDDVNYELIDQLSIEEMSIDNALELVFENGVLIREQTLAEIRSIVIQELKYAS